MRKNLLIGVILSAALLALSGCNKNVVSTEKNSKYYTNDYQKKCIDNIVYLMGYQRMAIWINPKTMKPSKCTIDKAVEEEIDSFSIEDN